MPLVRIDSTKGRSKSEVRRVLEIIRDAAAESFKAPQAQWIQIYQEHPADKLIAEGFDPDVDGSNGLLVVTIVMRPQPQQLKRDFFRTLCDELTTRGAVAPSELIVTILTNSDADWSLGGGRQTFITDPA